MSEAGTTPEPTLEYGYDHWNAPYFTLRNAPTREWIEALLGHAIPDEVWDFVPWGHRIVCRRDKAEEKYGRIIIPDRSKEVLQSGTIIKVGEGVGVDRSDRSASCPYPDPAHLVGLPVIFGQFAPKVILTSVDRNKSDPYDGQWVILHEDDIWGHSNTLPQKWEGQE